MTTRVCTCGSWTHECVERMHRMHAHICVCLPAHPHLSLSMYLARLASFHFITYMSLRDLPSVCLLVGDVEGRLTCG